MKHEFKKKPDSIKNRDVQSWYEPALHTLDGLLGIRRANLRRINRDENNAAVTKEEYIEMLICEHRLSAWYASEIILSLLHAKRIEMFGRFIQIRNGGNT